MTTAVVSIQIVQESLSLDPEWMQELHLTTVVKEKHSSHFAILFSFQLAPVVLL